MSKKKRQALRATVSVYSTTVRPAVPATPVACVAHAPNGDYDTTTAVLIALRRVLSEGRPFSRSIRNAAHEHNKE